MNIPVKLKSLYTHREKSCESVKKVFKIHKKSDVSRSVLDNLSSDSKGILNIKRIENNNKDGFISHKY
jgi:hypothetical protein